MGRRSVFGAVAAAFLALGGALPAFAGDVVRQEALGLSVTRPTGWQTLTPEAMQENLRRLEFDSKEFQEMLQKYSRVPAIAFSEHAEPYDKINPVFRVNARPAGALAGSDAVTVLGAILPVLKKAFKDFVVEEGPTATRVSGLPAAHVRVAYVTQAAGQNFPTVSEMWIVPRDKYFFIFGVGYGADERETSGRTLRAVMDSVRIETPS